eukprot:191246_1
MEYVIYVMNIYAQVEPGDVQIIIIHNQKNQHNLNSSTFVLNHVLHFIHYTKKCICGESLIVANAKDCYIGRRVICNMCRLFIENDIYHCPKEKTSAHSG